ncbi:MAG: hypothetical protein LAO20_21545 [Acidobacteriia bacterium]|nr:hypothetical protein [Terriglobia bacterium]
MTKRYSPEVQQALARVLQVKIAHEEELLKLPGVHSVSVQPKRTGGRRTTEFAIVVHVVKKKGLGELKPNETVPTVIDGVSTDVVESPLLRPSAAPSTDTDDNHYPHVLGGAEIVSDGMTRTTAGANPGQFTISRAKGTLGCLAINQATNDPSKKAVALTNAHVLLDVAITTTHDGAAVGQPDTSSLCCKSLDHTIGHVDHDVQLTGVDEAANPPPPLPTGVDAGFVTLDPEVQWSAEVIASGVGDSITTEQIAGAHAVDGSEALFDFSSGTGVPIYAVHKRGIRTELTKGWLVAITTTAHLPYESLDRTVTKHLKFFNQLNIEPQDPTKFFALRGDSGSAVLNDSHQVIGLVYGVPADSDPPNSSVGACPIAEVQTRLGVLVADSATFPGVQTVPKPAAAPHAFAELPAEPAVIRKRMQTARAELEHTELGCQLDAALHRHFGEIRTLVNANKRTAAIWRRIRGPAWISEALQCLLDPGRRFPAQLEGRSLSDCFDRFAAVLYRYGSPGLVDDLKKLGPELRSLAGRSYQEMLAAWQMQVTT